MRKSVRAATKKNIKQSTKPGPIYSKIMHELYLRAFETAHPAVLAHYKSDDSIIYLSSKAFIQDAQTADKVGFTDPFPRNALRSIIPFLESIHETIIDEGIDGNMCAMINKLRAPTQPVLAQDQAIDDDHKHAIKTLLIHANFEISEQLRNISAKILNMLKLITESLLTCILVCKRLPAKDFLAGICYASGYPDALIKLADLSTPKKKSIAKEKSEDEEEPPAPKKKAEAKSTKHAPVAAAAADTESDDEESEDEEEPAPKKKAEPKAAAQADAKAAAPQAIKKDTVLAKRTTKRAPVAAVAAEDTESGDEELSGEESEDDIL